jgi:protein-tyrosine kinase
MHAHISGCIVTRDRREKQLSQVFKALKKAGVDVSREVRPLPGFVRRSGRVAPVLPKTVPAEYVRLYFAIEALREGSDPYVLQFVAATRGEGTSTVAANFARIAASERAEDVLIVDCSSSPRSAEPSELEPATLIETYRDGRSLRERLNDGRSTSDEAFSVSIGRSRRSLLDIDSHGLTGVLANAREEFAITVLDCSATTQDPQAAVLSKFCDGTVLVVQAEASRRQVVEAARKDIERHGGNVIGVVLNRRRFYIPNWVYRHL